MTPQVAIWTIAQIANILSVIINGSLALNTGQVQPFILATINGTFFIVLMFFKP